MIRIINNNKDARALLKELMRLKVVSADIETEGFDRLELKMCMLQLGTPKLQNLIDVSKVNVQIFRPLLEDSSIVKIFHGSIFDCTWLKHEHNIEVCNIYDTMNGEKVMQGVALPMQPPSGWTKAMYEALKPKWSSSLTHCLARRGWPDKLEFELFTYGKPWTKGQIKYSARDIEFLEPLMEDQMERIRLLGLENVMELENCVAEVFYSMSATGFAMNTKGWSQYADTNEAIYKEAITHLEKYAKINWGAPGQTCKFFGVKYIAELEALDPLTLAKDKQKAYQYWKNARMVNKWCNTFGNSWLVDHVHNGVVYCDYTQIVNTGRCSCNSPNLQQIPVRNDAKHRQFFIPRKGNLFCIGDFSGQELAIMAVGSQEPVWLATLRAGGDLHAKCAELMSKVSGKDIPRRMAKTLNFTMGYGGGAATVTVKLKNDYDIIITQEEAQELINIYFKTFPKLKKWLDDNGWNGIKYGKTYSFEPFNRLRVLALEDEDWRKRNIGKNAPVQGTGADMTKLAMWYMYKALREELNREGFLVHQLHDELVVECKKSRAKECKALMIRCMNEACELILGEPLSAPDVHIKEDWRKAA